MKTNKEKARKTAAEEKNTTAANLTEMVFILDRSGSMHGLEEDTIGGFNSMIDKQKKEEGTAFVSTVLFCDESRVIHDRVEIGKIEVSGGSRDGRLWLDLRSGFGFRCRRIGRFAEPPRVSVAGDIALPGGRVHTGDSFGREFLFRTGEAPLPDLLSGGPSVELKRGESAASAVCGIVGGV